MAARPTAAVTEREWLEALEASDEPPLVPLAYLASDGVELDDGVLNAARRRALLVLAAGGDPHRGLELDGPAVASLARDLDAPERRAALTTAFALLREQAEGLPFVTASLDRFTADPELAWRAFAAALLADELADD
jgi:hypothetical protein